MVAILRMDAATELAVGKNPQMFAGAVIAAFGAGGAATLSRMGYRVLEAPNGVSALKVWKEHPKEISLLLTDLLMPEGMTGNGLRKFSFMKIPN